MIVAESNKLTNLLEARNHVPPPNNSISAPPTCQVEEQAKPNVKLGKGKIKFTIPPPSIKKYSDKLSEKYARRKKRRLRDRIEEMQEQERTLARMQDRMLHEEANAVQSSIERECNMFAVDTSCENTISRNFSSSIIEWCNHVFGTKTPSDVTSSDVSGDDSRIRAGVLDGSIASMIADSGTTKTVGTLADEEHFEETDEISDKVFAVANGALEAATKIAKLKHNLRDEARRVHLVPGINSATLLSTGELADAKYISIFDEEEVNIYDANNTKITTTRGSVLRGYRDRNAGVYRVPLVDNIQNVNTDTVIVNVPPSRLLQQHPPSYETVNSVYELRSQEEIIRFYHAAAGYPTKATWIKAVNRGYFASWPGLTAELIRKHFPESEETQKGHMRATRSGVRSTKKKLAVEKKEVEVKIEEEAEESANPTPQSKQRDIFVRILDTQDDLHSKIFTDQTGPFPRKSSRGNQYIMVLVELDSNYIMIEPMTNRTAGEMVRVYQILINRLNARGIFPKLHILDNEISAQFEDCIAKNKITFQLVPPHNHRVNIAERGIQTFKAHLISTLCGCDEKFPIHLWCRLLPQVEMTLNMLRPSRTTPNVSSYAHLYGQHDYNAHPLVPVGVQAEIHVMPDVRRSYSPHSVSGFNVGTSLKHYRCYKIWVKETRSVRVGNSVFFKHKYLTMPTTTNADSLLKAANDMTTAIEGGIPQSSETASAIDSLMKIFQKNADDAKEREEAAKPQRVRMREAEKQRMAMEREHAASQRVEMQLQHASSESECVPDDMVSPETVSSPSTTTTTTITHTVPPLEVEYPSATDNIASSHRRPNLISQEDNNAHDTPASNTRSRQTRSITQEAMLLTMNLSATEHPVSAKRLSQRKFPLSILCAFAGAVLDGTTGEMLEYRHLIQRPQYKDIWMNKSFGDEVGRLTQGRKGGIEGTDTMFFIHFDQIPLDRIRDITNDRIVCMVRPEKDDPNRSRLTVNGARLSGFPGDLGTPTADLLTVKLLLNSVISTTGAKFMGIDIKNFYLNTPMERFEYMKMKLSNFPQDIIDQYKLNDKEKNGYVYVEIRKGMYGIPAAGILAQKLLEERLAKSGYHQSEFTPGFWTHEWRPICFTLVVDDFGVKYVGEEHANHLLAAIKEHYECKADWDGARYLGLILDWDYEKREVHLSMPEYVMEALQRFQHKPPKHQQHQPHKHVVPTYGQKVQYAVVDESEPLDKEGKTFIQQVTGTFLYYARAVDPTMLVALSAIASAQANPTVETMNKCKLFLDYASTHPDAITTYRASEMVLAVDSDASYLIEPKARSRAGGHFYMSNNTTFPTSNGAVLDVARIIKSVMTSAAEAEMGALYINAREAVPMRITLEEMGHPQPPTPMQTDNTTALGVITNNIRKKQSKAWDMRMFWLRDREVQKQFRFFYRPGPTNIKADYQTKHFSPSHHQNMRPELLTPVQILNTLRTQQGKELPIFTDRERVC